MNNFEMVITEVFTLSDDTTVFVGSITSAEGNIGPCRCELILGGSVIDSFPTDGEMILKNKASGARAISTTHRLKVSDFDCQNGKLVLRGMQQKRTPSP